MTRFGTRLKHLGRRDYTAYVVLGTAFAFVCVFLIYPIFRTILYAFVPKGAALAPANLTIANFEKFWTSTMYLRSLRNSLYIGLAVVGFTSLIGVPMGYFVARVNIPLKRVILTLGTLPLIMPAFVGAFSWIILLGRQGALRLLLQQIGITLPPIYGPFGIIFTMSMMYYPFMFLLSHAAFEVVNPQLEESAVTMGARLPRIIRTITLPLVLPSIGAGGILVFVRAIGNFGIPAIVGGNTYVLPTLIYFQVNGFWNLNAASAISLVSVVITGISLWAQRSIVSKREYETISAARSALKQHSRRCVRILASIFCWVVLIISLLPQITLVVMSFFESWYGLFPKGFTLEHYAAIPRHFLGPGTNSLLFATAGSLGAAAVGTLVAYITQRRSPRGSAILDYVVMLPFILPGIVVAVALLSTFSSGLLILRGTYVIMLISFIIRRMPYAFRSVSAGLAQLDPSLEEASTLCGATWFRTFRKITVPIILPTIIAGTILAFVTLLTELSTSILLYGPQTRTLSIVIYDQVQDGRFGSASALSVLLFALVIVVMYSLSRYSGKSISSSFKMG